jgi:O-antigen ligase
MWIKDFRNLKPKFQAHFNKIAPLLAYFLLIIVWGLRSPGFMKFTEPYLMFLFIPLMGYPVFSSGYFSRNLNVFISSFIFGILTICLFEFARALFNSVCFTGGRVIFNPDIDFNISATSFDYLSAKSRFRSVELSYLEHPPYLALKIIFAIALIIEFRKELKFPTYINVLITGILLVFLFALSARIGFIIPAIIILYYMYRFSLKHRIRLVFFLILPLFLFGTYKIASLNPRVREKTELLISRLDSGKDLREVDPRFTSWLTSSELILRHPVFGVGPEARDILAAEYMEKGLREEADLRLNSHNQFLETQLTFGVLGTFILLWMLITPARQIGRSSKPSLIIIFMIIIITSLLFESVLVRQWGIMFFVMFYCLIMFLPEKENPMALSESKP